MAPHGARCKTFCGVVVCYNSSCGIAAVLLYGYMCNTHGNKRFRAQNKAERPVDPGISKGIIDDLYP